MKLDLYLEKHGETVEEFAERAGISKPTAYRVVKNGSQWAPTIAKVVAATGGQVSADELSGESLTVLATTKKRRRVA